MKANKLFLTLCLLAMATTASAQFANTGAGKSGKSGKSGSVLVKDTDPYNRIYVSYSPMNLKIDVEGADDIKLTGLTLGYLHGFNLSSNLPLFLEVGGNVAYSYGDFEAVDYKLLSVNVPVNVAYKLSFAGSDFSLTPFLGINFRYNIVGKMKNDSDYDDYGDYGDWSWDDWGYSYDASRSSINLFDKDEMGDSKWKHFQMGWQIGVGFNYKKLYVGISYGSDFSEIVKKTKAHTTQISLGLNF